VVFALVLTALADPVRESRVAMGTVVGITVDAPDTIARPAIEAAYAAIEAGEALASEWRPGSVTARLVDGVDVPPEVDALLRFCLDLRERSGGAFDVMWRGGELRHDGAHWSSTARPDLGGVLKGWLNDRAAAALRAAGAERFLVDAAGDVYAAGDWEVEVWGVSRVTTVHLHDQALSTSGNTGQPGHVTDARTHAPVLGARLVTVIAPTGLVADGVATAVFASGDVRVAEGYGAAALLVEGGRRWSRGARRVFR
jgi:thiamine biosynthesis lipoprotein